MKKLLSLTTILLSLQLPVFAQSNITGWGKAQWDMTSEQVKKEYPQVFQSDQKTIEEKTRFCLAIKRFVEEKCKTINVVQINDFIIGSFPFRVQFIYAENKLKEIELFYQGGDYFTYAYLFDSLTSKYGKPTTDLMYSTRTWTSPSGEIVLKFDPKKWVRATYKQVEQNL